MVVGWGSARVHRRPGDWQGPPGLRQHPLLPAVLLAPERSDGVSSGNWGFIYFFQLVSFCVLFLKSFRRIVTSLIVCNVPLGCC